MSEKYDIAIIGSGIAGSSLAAILARHGKKVIVFESKSHPRFAIGESMILETSETLRALATFYDVPELAYYSSENYFPLIGYSHGVKRHFSYMHHCQEEAHDIGKAFQAVIPKDPHGHELHVYRQDSDFFLMSTAISYGATVLQNTSVEDIIVTSDQVEIKTQQKTFSADYIVDSGGFKSILAEKFKLRDFSLQTHSRGIFTHMINVPDIHDVINPKEQYGFPFSLAEGTLHHIFDGGWLWVIPFNNHRKSINPLCSVGLMLDPRIHPENPDLGAEDEFFAFIKKFPDIEKHLKGAKSVRNWTRTGRIQYASKKVVGDRFALLGHAAGFIDPLYSKGMYSSLSCVAQLAGPLLDCDKDYPTLKFKPYEKRVLAFVRAHDRLVANSYKSFQNYKLWSVYMVLWLLGAYTELTKLISSRTQANDWGDYIKRTKNLHLVGGDFEGFDKISNQIDNIIEEINPKDEKAVLIAVEKIRQIYSTIDWMPDAFLQVLNGKNHLPKNKLKLSFLQPSTGFMGHGEYRDHFFGQLKTLDLVKTMIEEKRKYSTSFLLK